MSALQVIPQVLIALYASVEGKRSATPHVYRN